MKFAASAGLTYTIQIANLGPECDTMLTLHDTDGSPQLAFNDDYGEGLDSRIDYTPELKCTLLCQKLTSLI